MDISQTFLETFVFLHHFYHSNRFLTKKGLYENNPLTLIFLFFTFAGSKGSICKEEEFMCDDGRCIHVHQICDLHSDCVDSSDEFCGEIHIF